MRPRKPQYTHFASIPFIRKTQRDIIAAFQRVANDILLDNYQKQDINVNSSNLMHLTLVMLTLDSNPLRQIATNIFNKKKEIFQKELAGTKLIFSKLGYFTRYNHKLKQNQVSVIYLKIQENEQLKRIQKAFDLLMHNFIADNVIHPKQLGDLRVAYDHKNDIYTNGGYHVTLFRLKNMREDELFKGVWQKLNKNFKSIDCQCDTLDLSTRFSYDETSFYRPLARIILSE